MKYASGDGCHAGGDHLTATLTVRAGTPDAALALLDFLDPGWDVTALPALLPGQQRLLIQLPNESDLHQLCRAAIRDRHVIGYTDRLWAMSAGGRITTQPRHPVRSADDLALMCAPGTDRLATAIAARPDLTADVTGRPNRVAVVGNGTALPGLGPVSPLAALPALEGKAALLAQLAGIDAVPICLDAVHADGVVAAVRAIAPTFGAINLTGVAAPASCDIERRLRYALDIPVYHDEQHGTPVAVLAALRNALRVTGRQLQTARVVVMGAGVTGIAVTRLLLHAGAHDVTVWTRHGVLGPHLHGLPPHTAWLATYTNPRRLRGGLEHALTAADAVIGLSAAGLLNPALIAAMASPPIVFPLARPEPEIRPDQLAGSSALVAATGHGNPNQISDLLAAPGVLRGLLNARAPHVTTTILLTAADVLSGLIGDELLGTRRLLPDVLHPPLVPTMAAAVAAVASSQRPAAADQFSL
ncbi:NAD-dependent malic enzyme [Dactylosporangium darangshiense]|uniref:NAD-dependent malic enzyme n=1 Tax=Dactylosporangium darangshiense TaxID=579108 RepID=A0ABP8DIH9_9ACTN